MGYGWTGAFMNKVSLISYMNNEHGLRWAFDSRPVPNFTPLMLVLKFHASTVVDGEANVQAWCGRVKAAMPSSQIPPTNIRQP